MVATRAAKSANNLAAAVVVVVVVLLVVLLWRLYVYTLDGGGVVMAYYTDT